MLKPYYQDEWVTIYHGDCREILPLIPDKSIDLVLTDPPFNSEKKMGKPFRDTSKLKISESDWFIDDKMGSRGYYFWLTHIFNYLYERMKVGGHIYLFANWRSLRNTMDALESNLFILNNLIVWDKKRFGIGFNYRPQVEYVIFASRGKARELNQRNLPDIIRTDRVKNSEMNTQVQKPVELLKMILSGAGKESDIFLDPFLGSGSTAVAAKLLNRKCIGIEIEEKYCEIAAKRCSQGVFNFSEVKI